MNAWILSLFAVVLACALVEHLLPEGQARTMRPYVHLLIALILLLMLSHPLLTLVHSTKNPFSLSLPESAVDTDYEQIFKDAISHRSRTELEEGLYALLAEEYGIAREHAALHAEFDRDGALTRLRVVLSGKALTVDPAPIENDLAQRFGCAVEVR